MFRSGVRVPIQDQPLQLLRLLLEAEGKVVTREQLRAALWPQGTFVDFEHAVNTAVKKLRQALEDSAEHPKFVETLPRIGYRFINAPEWVFDVSDNNSLHQVVPIAPPRAVTVAQNPPSTTGGATTVTRSKFPPLDLRMLSLGNRSVNRAFESPNATLLDFVGWSAAASRRGVQGCYPNPGAPRVVRFTQLTNDGQGKKGVGALVTDGSRIYFNETLIDQRPIIVQVSVTGGEAVPLAVPLKQPRVLDLSRDGTELLIANDDGFDSSSLWVESVVGGSPRHIGTVPIIGCAVRCGRQEHHLRHRT